MRFVENQWLTFIILSTKLNIKFNIFDEEKAMKPELTEVPETMLWTLHNRAGEAMRGDAMLRDDEAVRIYRAIDYDYERSFGKSEPSHAVRSSTFDAEVRAFLEENPDGVVVNLGEGLETQRFRIEDEQSLWLSVDLPDAIAIRERFIEPDDRHLHVARSALDFDWMDEVPPGREVFVTAQGLLMYFEERDVEALMRKLAERFPGVRLMFDSIPPWLSNKTMSEAGFKKTKHYTTPRMPWGIRETDLEPTLRGWVPDIVEVRSVLYEMPRGVNRWLIALLGNIQRLRNFAPLITYVRFGSGDDQ
ncbi:MAG: class I SAM-dependent methyltransferase [Myxococcota bacterium]